MTVKQRFIAALECRKPDRLVATTHHLMEYYLNTYEGGCSTAEFFIRHQLDRIEWIAPFVPDESAGQYWSDPLENRYRGIVSDQWRVSATALDGFPFPTERYTIETPAKHLSMVLQSNAYTSWVTEPFIKDKSDIDIIARYAPSGICDTNEVRKVSLALGDEGLLRSNIPSFDIMGQPGCWQDAALLYGIERLILETFDDPQWVSTFLGILQRRKLRYIESTKGAPFDLIELGGGDASTTVISPRIFEEFVAPFDQPLIEAAHRNDQRIVYHTCGGMMPILEDLVAMGPDALETFTPPGMGGDVDLAEAYRRIGGKVCFIGGLDQGAFLIGCSAKQTQQEVLRCFEACGKNGGYIISPSDHFFDADPRLLDALAQAAALCRYE